MKSPQMKISEVSFAKQLPSPKSFGPANVLLYDEYFDRALPALAPIQAWLAKFPARMALTSGEGLKDLRLFPERMEAILSLVSQLPVKNVQLIGLGGGSVGDFTGFVASILKRGVPLVHVPTTWLSAMDSSHGGKTALNVAGFKNQIGSFYPADRVVLVKPILLQQPEARAQEAFGEAVKMAFLRGGKLWSEFSDLTTFDNELAWRFLPELIDGKYKVVKQDPFEKKGVRHLLNLGHTLGHVWEASQQLQHGLAVAYGIRAALELSRREAVMSAREYERLHEVPVMRLLPSLADLQSLARNSKDVGEYLVKDKKLSKKSHLRFVFIERPGKCPIHDIKIDRLVKFHDDLASSRVF